MEDMRCNKCTFMLAFIELSFLTLYTYHCLPTSQMAITAALMAVNITITIANCWCYLFIECHSIFDCLPLLGTQFSHITREAHTSQKRVCNCVSNAFNRICLSNNGPNLALSRQNCSVKCCCNNWNFLTLMRIGEGCHAALTHHQWL